MSIWDAEKPGAKPGFHLLEVESVSSEKEGRPRRSKNGDLFWIVTYRLVRSRDTVDDIFMLQGKGAWYTALRCEALGFTRGEAEPTPHDLVGRRVWAKLVNVIEKYNGQDVEKVKIDGRPKDAEGKPLAGHFSGLWPESSPPPGAVVDPDDPFAPVDGNADSDGPF